MTHWKLNKRRQYTTEDLKAILGIDMIWPLGLQALERYERVHDDHDGTNQGSLVVTIGEDGDAWVDISGKSPMQSLRYRTMLGGGSSPHTRNALILLALAIKLDQETERHG